MVCDLLESGWSAEDLSLVPEWSEDDQNDDAELPPVLQGAELATRARTGEPPKGQRISA